MIVSQSSWDTLAKFRKLFLIMKLTAILCIVVCLHVSAIGYGQNKISIKVKDIALKHLFTKLQKQTSYRFLYEDSQLPKNARFDVDVENESIQGVLDNALRNSSLQYKILNNNLVVITSVATGPAVRILNGEVRDESGEPLPGANIQIKGSRSGATSDANGRFSIEVTENTTLIISFIGYITQEINAPDSGYIRVNLVPGDKNLNEVVVVGFGVQKKANLTGAVDVVTSQQLESRPLSSLGGGLQGLIPNLNITLDNGRATTAANFNIRGFTSINGGEPLILVDNVPFTMAEVAMFNPNDIETVSVLKDAAASAIYGSRAAFGVVLITTKSAKGNKMNVSVNANMAFRTVGKLPELVTDPYLVMKYKHDAAIPLYNLFPDAARVYAKERSENPSLPAVIINPTNTANWAYYGSTDWIKEAYEKGAPTYNTNISLSKKSEKLSYYFSGDYYRQDGMLRFGNDIYNRYNVRGKVDLNATHWLTFSNNTLLTGNKYDSPVFIDGDFFWNVNRTSSLDVPKNPDGSWTSAGASLLGRLQEGGRADSRTNDFQTTFSFNAALVKDVWDVKGEATVRRGATFVKSFDIPIGYKTGPNNPIGYAGSTNTWAQNGSTNTNYTVLNLYTDFHKNIGSHFVQGLVGYNQEYRIAKTYTARRNNLIANTLPSIGLSTGSMVESENIGDYALRGLFYRLAYNYKNRYLLELNGRYDGSSRFPQNKRWGFFPSASAGWLLSEEQFMAPVKSATGLTLLKVRGSYGSLGNQSAVGNYDYIPTMSSAQVGQILGTGRPMTVNAPGAVSDNFSWETVSTLNFGLDLGFFSNRLEFNFDKYTRYTRDMLIAGKTLPAVFGTSVPRVNAGDLKTSGWELRLNWRDKGELAGSPFFYNINFSLADNRTTITRFDNPTKLLSNYYVGQQIGEIWGAEIEGFFQNEDELKSHPNQRAMGTDDQSYQFFVGDPKFKDRNNDGIVDKGNSTVDNPGDLYKIGNSTPRLAYGLDLSGGWKGFDLRAFLQGVGKRDWYPGASNVYFWGVYAQPWTNVTVQNLDSWTPDNRDAYFPAIRAYTAEDNMEQLGIPNKRYLQNAAYMRVKNITLGYTLPRSILKKVGLEKVRFYISGENLFEISHIKVNIDPESFGKAAYPFQRTYSCGLNFNF